MQQVLIHPTIRIFTPYIYDNFCSWLKMLLHIDSATFNVPIAMPLVSEQKQRVWVTEMYMKHCLQQANRSS